MSSPHRLSGNAAHAVPVSEPESQPCALSDTSVAGTGVGAVTDSRVAAGPNHDDDVDDTHQGHRCGQPPAAALAVADPIADSSTTTTPTPSSVSPFLPPPSADKVPNNVPDSVPDFDSPSDSQYMPHGDANARDTLDQTDTLPISSASSNKKARGPGPIPRQSGPSLLTQALASARGITNVKPSKSFSPTTTSTTTTTTIAISPTSSSSTTTLTTTSVPGARQSNLTRTAAPSATISTPTSPTAQSSLSSLTGPPTAPANLTSQSDRDSASYSFFESSHHNVPAQRSAPRPLTRATSESVNMGTSTTTATMTSLAPREAASVPSSFNHSTLATLRGALDNRETMDGPRVKTSTSLDLDRQTVDSYHPQITAYTAALTDRPIQSETRSGTKTPPALIRKEDVRNAQTRPSPWGKLPPHWTSNGTEKTEKIWSIGSADGHEEDGLVEKSVTEAMAGLEHNARSRKSSYSLRFFKEGLPPEDKLRRRDSKTPREKLAPLKEGRQHASREAPQPGISDKDLTPTCPPPEDREGSFFPADPLDEQPALSTSPSEDYFSLPVSNSLNSEQITPLQVQQPSSQAKDGQEQTGLVETASSVGPTPVTDAETIREPELVDTRRDSADSARTEVGSREDGEADESGEEKISSAVFLPHQELQEPGVSEPQDRIAARSIRVRSMSQSNQRPWLVKADEPEPEAIDEKDEPPYGISRHPSREALTLKRGDLIPARGEEGAVIEEEITVTTDSLKQPQIVSQFEDHVHDHQHDPQEPLEAIELIPYKHQVGGHTTLWRFSRRAVCKQLNNRENEFYETIERYHRDLLPFLPRYVSSKYVFAILCYLYSVHEILIFTAILEC